MDSLLQIMGRRIGRCFTPSIENSPYSGIVTLFDQRDPPQPYDTDNARLFIERFGTLADTARNSSEHQRKFYVAYNVVMAADFTDKLVLGYDCPIEVREHTTLELLRQAPDNLSPDLNLRRLKEQPWTTDDFNSLECYIMALLGTDAAREPNPLAGMSTIRQCFEYTLKCYNHFHPLE